MLCAFARSGDSRIRVTSVDLAGRVELDEKGRLVEPSATFGKYVQALVECATARGMDVPGLSFAVASTIPAGGGMSSSAAFCVALTVALSAATDWQLPPLEVALIAQEAEHRVGVNCGLMDQYAISFGKRGHALLLDTRKKTHRDVPLDLGGWCFVVGDTKKSRGLIDSEYNARRRQVEDAARLIDNGSGTIKTLRDVTPERLDSQERQLHRLLFRRASHVVGENARTIAAAELLSMSEDADAPGEVVRGLGALMDASHASLRDLFDVSCLELDALVVALKEEGSNDVAGARMMGGGFGGCVIALVRSEALGVVLDGATRRYREATGLTAEFFPVQAADGARVLP